MFSIKRLKFFFFCIYSYFPQYKNWEPIACLVCSLSEESSVGSHEEWRIVSVHNWSRHISRESGLAIMEKIALKYHTLDVGWKDWQKFLAEGNVLPVLWTTSGHAFGGAEEFVTLTDNLAHEDLVWLCCLTGWGTKECQRLLNPAKSKEKRKLQGR